MTPDNVLPKPPISEGWAGPPFSMAACLVLTDVVTLLLSVALSVACKLAVTGRVNLESYLRLSPFLFVFIAVYAAVGLYSGVALSPPDELRRATLSSALVFALLAAATVSFRGASRYFTWTLFLAMGLSVVLLPLMRALVRQMCAGESWWGCPAVVFGADQAGRRIVRALLDDPGLGLKPVAVVDDAAGRPAAVHGVPVIARYDVARAFLRQQPFAYAVVAMPGERSSRFLGAIERYGLRFSRILVIPELFGFSSLWVNPKSVGGMLGLEVCQPVFAPERQCAKRVLDLVLTLAGGVAALPLLGLIAAWVKWDSPGPVFYSQRRVGYGGREFRAWKFRSMIQNADQVLQPYLEANPGLREEWERNHKLRNDPRLTRAGRFLRRTSLDELPQLWNVLKGEMSLVGPRPIVRDEIARYGDSFNLYKEVQCGLTGLWQISGRNDTSYEERVRLDTFYARNWSVWLDLCILFRTIGAVVLRKGAY